MRVSDETATYDTRLLMILGVYGAGQFYTCARTYSSTVGVMGALALNRIASYSYLATIWIQSLHHVGKEKMDH